MPAQIRDSVCGSNRTSFPQHRASLEFLSMVETIRPNSAGFAKLRWGTGGFVQIFAAILCCIQGIPCEKS